jgi:N-acetylglucosaminyldiphosphoundecaprenol N-acetyl-beta-D-mannosaminyltransferase
MDAPSKLDFLGLPISRPKTIAHVLDEAWEAINAGTVRLTTFVNPYSYWLAREHPELHTMLGEFDEVLCDGQGLVAAAAQCGLPGIQRISFDSTSLAPVLFNFCSKHDLKVFLVGGAPGVAEQAASTYQSACPGLMIAGTHSGFFDDPEVVIAQILATGSRVVICGMGSPRQEAFLLRLKEAAWHGIGFTCGGYLDQSRGQLTYYPAWVDRLNLRFAFRLASEPRRLWKRYLIQYWWFVYLVAQEVLSGKRDRWRLGKTEA